MIIRDPLAWMPIKYKLTLTMAGICLIAFGVGGYFISHTARTSLEREITLRLRAQSTSLAHSLDHALDLLGRRTEDFASDGYIRTKMQQLLETHGSETSSHAVAALRTELRTHLLNNKLPLVVPFQALLLFSPDGALLLSSSDDDRHTLEELATAFRSDTLSYGHIIIGDDASFYPAMTISTPIWDITHTHRIGFLISCVNISRWISSSNVAVASGDSLHDKFSFMVKDRRGSRLFVGFESPTREAASNGADSSSLRRVFLRPLTLGAERVHRATGRDVISSSYVIPSNRWNVTVEVDAEQVMLPVEGIGSRFLGTGIVIAIVTVLILLFPIQFVIRPLTQMRDAARRMTQGDFSTRIAYDSDDEIGELGRAFNLMTDAVSERTNKLEHAAALLEKRSVELRLERDLLTTVVHSMKDGLIYIDRHGTIVLYNAAAAPLVEFLNSPNAAPHARFCMKETNDRRSCIHCLLDPNESTAACTVDMNDRVFEILAAQIRSDQRSQGRILVSRDVTSRMRIDEREAHQERLAVIGEVSAVMAHELNNPLAAISMFNQMMEKELPTDSPYREHIDVIKRNTDICKQTIRGLLDYARGATPEIGDVNVHDVIIEVVRFLRPMYEKSRIAFEMQFDAAQPVITSDEMYVRQIFVNVVLNAVQAMDANEGSIVIQSRDDASAIVIDCIDSGPGIPKENHERIFEPFFTNRTSGKGTGLGLPTSRRIVEALSGSLELISSDPGRTVFRIMLPRVANVRTWYRIPGDDFILTTADQKES